MPRPRIRLPGRASTLGRPAVIAVAVLLVVVAVASFVLLRDTDSSRSAVRTEESVRSLPESPGSSATVDIDTTLYLPDTSSPAPAVLLAHGFGGDKNSVAEQARDLASRGLVVLAYSARGFGASTGSIGLNDPDREVADARGLIDYLATRPEVQLDSPGDPRVGVAGGSYGGALALMAAGTDPRIDADAASITWNDLNQSLFPNYAVPGDTASDGSTPAVSAGSDAGVLKRGWAGIFFGAGAAPAPDAGGNPAGGEAPSQNSSPAGACGRFALQVCLAYADSAVSGQPSTATSELLRARSPISFASSITAPTLLVQGQRDTLFGLDQADATARQIAAAGGSVQVRWFDGGHDAGGTDAVADGAVADFLVQHLTGDRDAAPSSPAPFTYALAGDPTDQGDRARDLTATDYPGLTSDGAESSTTREDFALTSTTGTDTQTIIRPPGASPSALTSLPGVGSASALGGAAALAGGAASALLTGDIPGQTASFATGPLTSSYTITGTSSVAVTVGPTTAAAGTVLFAKLYDVADDGRRTLPEGLVSAFRVPPSDTPTTVRVTLPGMAYQVAAGHRVEVAFSTTDQAYAVPLDPAAVSVTLADATLSLPSVPAENTESTFPIVPVVGIAALAVLIAALVGATSIRARRRTVAEVDESLRDVPLVITDLAKSYANGFRAVDDVSFRVGAGQVLGLLGPNGAGKTTTLRMLMGLITPSAGEIRVFGHLVTPGAPVLSRLGSFVEGSGFLPHLSGMENLDLYWRATGRPADDAHLEEALEIADLGSAIHRKVRSYSQGMRQRLAIAQAMLGLPDLMVLDEPTNGLDPPQIRTMRDVLIRYAQTGRTVLVSSHLLAEVEQTCTHVVVMNKGVVISSGTVDDLIGASGPVEFRVDRVADTVALLTGIDGMGDVTEVEPAGTVKAQLGTLDPAVVIRALVDAGIGVSSAARSTRLEDVFLDLVHDDTDRLNAAAHEGVGV